MGHEKACNRLVFPLEPTNIVSCSVIVAFLLFIHNFFAGVSLPWVLYENMKQEMDRI